MPRFLSLVSTSCLVTASIAVAGCHHAPPVAAPVAVATNDDAAARARARADSIAKADAARRDSIARANARADSLRRAEDASRAAAAARAQLLEPIHFELDRAEILASDRTLLDQKASILTANQSLRIRIDGNADERGSDEYNLALGMRRAAQARHYLSDRGIDSMRVAIASNGEEKPLCTDHEESCWSRNRRAEFVIVSGGERLTAAR
jgi:peptidoglycan-associated lipoprotein